MEHNIIRSSGILLSALAAAVSAAGVLHAGGFEEPGALRDRLQAVTAQLQDFGARQAASALLTKAEQRAVLRAIDDHCADSWCEGDYEFEFRSFSCAPGAGGAACELKFDMKKDGKSAAALCKAAGISTKTEIIAGVSGGGVLLAEGFLRTLDGCVADWEDKLAGRLAPPAASVSGGRLRCEFHKGSADPRRPDYNGAAGVRTVRTLAEGTRHEESFGALSATVQFHHGKIIQAMIFDQRSGAMTASSPEGLAASDRASLLLQDMKSGDFLGLECAVAR